MTNLEALAIIHAVESFLRLPKTPDGKHYGPGFFIKRNWVDTLKAENRRVSMRLCKSPFCIKCFSEMSAESTGDHIIPLALGGPQGAQNYLPLCRSCNASKGKRDLLDWWLGSGKRVAELSPDILCAYSRLMFVALGDRIHQLAGSSLIIAVDELMSKLPTKSHGDELLKTIKQQIAL